MTQIILILITRLLQKNYLSQGYYNNFAFFNQKVLFLIACCFLYFFPQLFLYIFPNWLHFSISAIIAIVIFYKPEKEKISLIL